MCSGRSRTFHRSPPRTTPAAPWTPAHIATRNGEVILPTSVDKQNYDEYGFAAVRRAGNWVFISGVIVDRRQDEGTDVEAFKAQTRRGFRGLESALKAAGGRALPLPSFGRNRRWPPPSPLVASKTVAGLKPLNINRLGVGTPGAMSVSCSDRFGISPNRRVSLNPKEH